MEMENGRKTGREEEGKRKGRGAEEESFLRRKNEDLSSFSCFFFLLSLSLSLLDFRLFFAPKT